MLIAIAPWFSLSSLFIIGSYFLVMLIKNPGAVLKTYIPFFISFLLFYFLSLRYVSSCNYDGMYNWWQNGYGFADLRHPLRIVLRFGELFSFDKLKALFCGTVMLVPAFISTADISSISTKTLSDRSKINLIPSTAFCRNYSRIQLEI